MIRVVVGIISRTSLQRPTAADREVLLCQRKSTSRYGLKWEFPGGKIEAGESPEEGLQRELREELGIEAAIGSLFHRLHHTYDDGNSYDVLYFDVASYTGEIFNHVFESVTWVPVSKLPEYDNLEGNAAVVRKLTSRHASSYAQTNQ